MKLKPGQKVKVIGTGHTGIVQEPMGGMVIPGKVLIKWDRAPYFGTHYITGSTVTINMLEPIKEGEKK